MHVLAHLLLVTALTIPTNTLVLRSGQRISIDSSMVTVREGRVLFQSHGSLFSVGILEVDLDATTQMEMPAAVEQQRSGRLRVSPEEKQRLLKQLEDNHSGTPGLPAELHLSPGPSPQEIDQMNQDEWSWRNRAHSYEESIRQAQEHLDLLRDKAAALQAHISGLLSLGYRPIQFSWDTTVLAYTLEAIPYAELDVQRVQRQYDQFREDARRMGVMPGWLR
jgi:hypothetical protein